jgi:hypothetical protein
MTAPSQVSAESALIEDAVRVTTGVSSTRPRDSFRPEIRRKV